MSGLITGSKLFDLLMVFLKEFFQKLNFEKNQQKAKNMKNYPVCIYFLQFQAWSSIVYQLIPNIQLLESNLARFASIIDANEVLLFEKATFLVS